MFEGCRSQLDDVEIASLHEWLKDKGKWKKGFCGADGSWNKERPACHGVYTVRSLETSIRGGIIAYHIMSTLDLEFPYLGTSNSMEVFGAMVVMSRLASLGFAEEELTEVLDGDSKAYKVAKTYFYKSSGT